MASTAPAQTSSKAIYAASEYIKFGEGASKHFGFAKHVTIAMTLGIGLGFVWKVRCTPCALASPKGTGGRAAVRTTAHVSEFRHQRARCGLSPL